MTEREIVLTKTYVSVTDIQRLFKIGYVRAKKIFNLVSADEDEDLQEYRIYLDKVQLKRVLKVTKTDFRLLKNQIQYESELVK